MTKCTYVYSIDTSRVHYLVHYDRIINIIVSIIVSVCGILGNND